MLPRPKRFALVKCDHISLGIAETLGAGLQTPPRLSFLVATKNAKGTKK